MRLRTKKRIVAYSRDEEAPDSLKRKFFKYFYMLLLLIIILYLIYYYLYRHILFVEASGYIEVPKWVCVAPRTFYIKNIFVKKNEYVKKGEPLFSIEYLYNKPYDKLSDKRLKLLERETKLKQLQSISNLLSRIDKENIVKVYAVYKDLKNVDDNISKLEEKVSNRIKKLNELKDYYSRLSRKIGVEIIATKSNFPVSNEIDLLIEEINNLKKRIKLLKKYRKELIEQKRKFLKIEIATLKKEIDLLKSSIYSNLKVQTTYYSPISGEVIDIFVKKRQIVEKGESVLSILIAKPEINLYISSKKIEHFHLGDEVDIFFRGRKIKGVIRDIYSAALSYNIKIKKNYIPVYSPVKVVVSLKGKFLDEMKYLDGIKVIVRVLKWK